MEESKEETKSGAVDWLVEEKKIGILDIGEDMRCNEDVILERKGEGNRLEEIENRLNEIVSCSVRVIDQLVEKRKMNRQCNKNIVLERKGKRDEKQLKIRKEQEMSKIREKLTKKR